MLREPLLLGPVTVRYPMTASVPEDRDESKGEISRSVPWLCLLLVFLSVFAPCCSLSVFTCPMLCRPAACSDDSDTHDDDASNT